MSLILRLLVNSLALFIVTKVVHGIHANSVSAIIWTALLLGIVNTLIRPIVQLFAIPVTLLTFGLFALVINAILFLIVGNFVHGFYIDGFGAAFIGSILLSIVSWILHKLTHLD